MRYSTLLACVLGIVLASSATMRAQDAAALFSKAPPEVDEALRKTVQEFIDLQLAKKWGASMKYIAEDSYDAYIGSEKEGCLGMELISINYNDNYTDATVAVACERGMATPVGGGRLKMPFTTYWRSTEDGWKWYTPKVERPPESEFVMTPFGPVPKTTPDMQPGQKVNRDENSTRLTPAVSMKDLKTPLEASPAKVILRPDRASTAKAKILNRFPGAAYLEIHWVELRGLSATIDKKKIAQNEFAEVTINFEPQGIAMPPKEHAVWIETFPMRSATPVLIEFQFEESESASNGASTPTP